MNKRFADFFGVTPKRNARANVAIGLLSGLLIGGVTGLLTAPQSGKETRRDLKEAAEKGLAKTREGLENAVEYARTKGDAIRRGFVEGKRKMEAKVNEAAANVAGKVADGAEKLAEHAENAAEKVKDGMEKAQDKAEDLAEKGKRAADKAADKVEEKAKKVEKEAEKKSK